SGRADIGGAARLAVAEPAEELDLDGDREVLILQHRARLLAVQHQTVVAHRPRWTAGHLLTDEAVLGDEAIVRERILEKDVAEFAVELLPLVVADFEHTILDAHRVVEVLAEIMLRELRRPAIEIATVEQWDPVLFARIVLRRGRERCHGETQKGGFEDRHACSIPTG